MVERPAVNRRVLGSSPSRGVCQLTVSSYQFPIKSHLLMLIEVWVAGRVVDAIGF